MKDFAKDNIREVEFGYDFDNENDFDGSVLEDIDFSQITGKDFKKTFPNVKRKIKSVKQIHKVTPKKSLSEQIPIRHGGASVSGGMRSLGKVIVPRDRKVIVEGVNKFILSDDYGDVKRINYYKGKKLKEVILNIDNSLSAVDMTFELFNPSMPLDYLYASSLRLNDLITVAESPNVSYTDLCFNVLANPLMVYNAKIAIAGSQASSQRAQPLTFVNKSTDAETKVAPKVVSLLVDNFQKDANIVNFFAVHKQLNRPFIPDGMDVIQYKVLSGNLVTIVFFCEQKQLKRLLYKQETEGNKLLI